MWCGWVSARRRTVAFRSPMAKRSKLPSTKNGSREQVRQREVADRIDAARGKSQERRHARRIPESAAMASTMSDPELELVHDWHVALNAGDTSRLLALSTSDVEVGGPRGAGRGSQLLEEWVARAQIRLEPLRWKA